MCVCVCSNYLDYCRTATIHLLHEAYISLLVYSVLNRVRIDQNTGFYIYSILVCYIYIVATVIEIGMAIDTKSRDHIANNSFVVSAPSEQQSVSSDISNPRQEKKDQQLSDAMSPSPNLIMDDEQPVLSIASPQLSPVALEPETTNTIKIATTPPPPQMQQPQKPQSLSPPTTTSAYGRDGSLPQMIDGYYPPHPQQPPTKHNPQNTNDSRKLFVGGLPKDGMCRRILEPIEQNLRSLCCFYSHVCIFFIFCFYYRSDGGRILLVFCTVRRNHRLLHRLRS